jgi:hypothetical protein
MQIIDCIALHNFIRGCELGDEEFYKCDDDDEDYMLISRKIMRCNK